MTHVHVLLGVGYTDHCGPKKHHFGNFSLQIESHSPPTLSLKLEGPKPKTFHWHSLKPTAYTSASGENYLQFHLVINKLRENRI